MDRTSLKPRACIISAMFFSSLQLWRVQFIHLSDFMHFLPGNHLYIISPNQKKKIFLEKESKWNKAFKYKSVDSESLLHFLSPSTTLPCIYPEVKPVRWAFALCDRITENRISSLSFQCANQASLPSRCISEPPQQVQPRDAHTQQ